MLNRKHFNYSLAPYYSLIETDRLSASPLAYMPVLNHMNVELLSDQLRSGETPYPTLFGHLNGDDTVSVCLGASELQAIKRSGKRAIQVGIVDSAPLNLLRLMLSQYTESIDSSELARAEILQNFADQYKLSDVAMAESIGVDRSWISNQRRLNKLTPKAKTVLNLGKISFSQARALLSAKSYKQDEILNTILVRGGMTVTQITDLIANKPIVFNDLSGQSAIDQTSHVANIVKSKSADDISIENQLSDSFGSRVEIARTGAGGSLSFHVHNQEIGEGILDKIPNSLLQRGAKIVIEYSDPRDLDPLFPSEDDY